MHHQQTHPDFSSSYSKFTSQTVRACGKYLSGMWWIRAAFAQINTCNSISLLYLHSFQTHRVVPFIEIRKCLVVIIPGVCHYTQSSCMSGFVLKSTCRFRSSVLQHIWRREETRGLWSFAFRPPSPAFLSCQPLQACSREAPPCPVAWVNTTALHTCAPYWQWSSVLSRRERQVAH